MPRVEIAQAVLLNSPDGVIVGAGASVQVNIRGGAAATVFAGATGPSTLSNPLTADSAGRIEGWVDQANDYDLVVSGAGFSTYTQPFVIPRGADGAAGTPGVGANWRGVWSSGTTYATGDGVFRNGLPYISNTSSNLNHDPLTDAVNWGALFQTPFGIDVWNSQANPASVTDWGAIINTLVSGGARRLLLGQHDFPYTTKLNFASSLYNGLVIDGLGGGQSWQRLENAPTRLIWKGGAASGVAVDLTGSDCITFRDLGVYYDNAAYDGDLIDGNSSGLRMERCDLGSTDKINKRGARSILKLNNVVGASFKDCTVFAGLTPIRGHETASTICNQVKFEDCMFESFVTAAVANGGNGWVFSGCCWEFPNSPANAQAFITDADPNDVASIQCENGCTFWDWSAAGQGVIKTLAAHHNKFHFTMRDCNVENGGAMVFGAPGSVVLENVEGFLTIPYPSAPYIDMGTSGGGSTKDYIIVRDCHFDDSNGTGDLTRAIANLGGGHGYIDVQGGNWTSNVTRTVRTTPGYKRVPLPQSGAQPTFALAGGQTGLTVPQKQLDHGQGIIQFNGDANAGIIGTLTFSQALIGVGGDTRLHITLSATNNFKGTASNPGTFYTSGVYSEYIGDHDLTGFKIGCAVGWTSKIVQVVYTVSVQG